MFLFRLLIQKYTNVISMIWSRDGGIISFRSLGFKDGLFIMRRAIIILIKVILSLRRCFSLLIGGPGRRKRNILLRAGGIVPVIFFWEAP